MAKVIVWGPLMLVLMLFPTKLMATDWTSVAAHTLLISGQGMDGLSTVRFLKGTRCVEGNPLFGPHPKDMTIIAAKSGIVLSNELLMRFANKRESKTAKRVAKVVALLAGGVGMKDGIANFNACGW